MNDTPVAVPTRRRPGRVLMAGMVAALLTAALVACGSDKPELVGYEVDPAPQVGAFTLTDGSDDDAPFPLKAAPGQLLIVFLGFTNCPDACPTAMAEVAAALDQIGSNAERVDVSMITVDPVRDTSPVLTGFVRNFVPDAIALRTDDQTLLQDVVKAFGGTADAEHDHEGMTTAVGHTDYIYVVDDTGTVILTWTAEMTTDDITKDLQVLTGRLSDPS